LPLISSTQVDEENGNRGGLQYASELNASGALLKHSFVLETDSGAFQPFGIGIGCVPGADCSAAQAQMALIGSTLLAGIGSGNVSAGGGGEDIGPSCETGVPCVGLNVLDPRLTGDSNNPCMNDAMGQWSQPVYSPSSMPYYDSQYFWVHHSAADTMERLDPRQLNHVAAALAVWAYSVASLPELLPRNEAAPPAGPSSGGSSSGPPVLAISVGLGVAALAVVAGLGAWRWRAAAGKGSRAAPFDAYSKLGASGSGDVYATA
jgi:carboxypeptidase Q